MATSVKVLLRNKPNKEGLYPLVWFGNKKFRLTTLGVGKEHLRQLSKEQERLENLKKLKGHRKNCDLER